MEFIDENEIKHSLVNTKIRIVNIGMRNKRIYKIDAVSGIDEKIYVDINGQQQYVFIRGIDVKNPIILYLHGGPANPDSFMTLIISSPNFKWSVALAEKLGYHFSHEYVAYEVMGY